MERNLDAKELYQKKKVKLAILGLFLSWISAVTLVVFQNFNVAATGIINESFSQSLTAAFVLTLITLSLCEFAGGLIMIRRACSRICQAVESKIIQNCTAFGSGCRTNSNSMFSRRNKYVWVDIWQLYHRAHPYNHCDTWSDIPQRKNRPSCIHRNRHSSSRHNNSHIRTAGRNNKFLSWHNHSHIRTAGIFS